MNSPKTCPEKQHWLEQVMLFMLAWQMRCLCCADTLSAEAKPKVDDKAPSKAGSKTEAAAALPEPGASLKYPSDAKAARPALGGLLRLNAQKDAAAQQV